MKRRFIFDIEVNWDRTEQFKIVLRKAYSPIQMFGCYDSYKNKYYAFFFHKNYIPLKEHQYIRESDKQLFNALKKVFRTPHFYVKERTYKTQLKTRIPCRYMYFNDERAMIRAFMQFVWDISPDLYGGFNVEEFDLPYTINRCRKLGLSASRLSPLLNVYISHGRAVIRGSVIYDIPKTYAKFLGSHRHQNSLKKLAESHLSTRKKKITKTSDSILDEDWYEKNWYKFIRYCLVDVELCVLLEQKLGLMDMAERIVDFTGVNPTFIYFDSHIIESFWSLIRPLYEQQVLNNDYKIAFATKKETEIDTASGADVFVSKRGFYKDGLVLILDLEKMYPKIIESLNISIETIEEIINECEIDEYIYSFVNGVYYKKDPIGFIPFSLKLLYQMRTEIETIRDTFEYGSKEWNEWNDKRQTIKDNINAVSGQFDYTKSMVLNPKCADSIRMTGKYELKTTDYMVMLFAERVGLEVDVLYGDTDSVFIHLKTIYDVEIALKIGEELCKWIMVGYDMLARKMNIQDHKFKIGLEKVLDVFVSIGKKKKYFGHILWAEGNYIKEENSLLIRGYQSRRSDSSEFTERSQKEIFKLVNQSNKKDWNAIRKKIVYKLRTEYPDEFKVDNVLEIGIPRRMKKPFDKYDVTNPWLEGCIYANTYLGANFDIGSKPKLLYIKEVKAGKLKLPHTNALCVEEGMNIPDGYFIVDKEKMMNVTVLNALKPTLEVLGISLKEIESGYKITSVMDFINEYSDNAKKCSKNENMQTNFENVSKLLEKSKNELIIIKDELMNEVIKI